MGLSIYNGFREHDHCRVARRVDAHRRDLAILSLAREV
jgi:hypothetical protein